MQIAEIRDLDGPNLFLAMPAIKLEVDMVSEFPNLADGFASAFVVGEQLPGVDVIPGTPERLVALLTETINVLHDLAGVPRPEITDRAMEEPRHYVVAFSWDHRSFARYVAKAAFEIVAGEAAETDSLVEEVRRRAATEPTVSERPEMLLDVNHHLPIVGITGTNGKTTTTRLLSSILMHAGKRVGWTSSSGVLIQGAEVLAGDYTGPAGAARVFQEPDLDVAVLETARGGILLRGLGYESNDVCVVTNISEDHLGLHGVHTVDELARVKLVVAQATRPEGYVVLNAEDRRVLAMRDEVRANVFLISRRAHNEDVELHIASGGTALYVDQGQVHYAHRGQTSVLTVVNEIPITLGGKAVHMLENALGAAAAALALGLDQDQVSSGLAAFRNEAGQNRGRLNVFNVNDATVIVDFAHNPAGLRHLLELGRAMAGNSGRLIAIIGSAGDRGDDALQDLGRIAGAAADTVIVKDTAKYLRGRQPGEIPHQVLKGIGSHSSSTVEQSPSEYDAFERSIALAGPGDAVAIMCIEDIDRILAKLESIGTPITCLHERPD